VVAVCTFFHVLLPLALRSIVTLGLSWRRTCPHRRPRAASSANGVGKCASAGFARPSA
jgi:hypothetical protein